MVNKSFPFVVTILLLIGCDARKIYDEYRTMDNQTWSADNIISFDVNIQDTVAANNVYLNIRNGNNYPYQNIFLFITITDPGGQFKKDTVEIFLADDKGEWYGKGIGSAYHHQVPLLTKVRFQYQGIYTFDLEQAMRKEKLPGVLDVGLRIERSKN
ncbi:MAG: gliding motility lipoprotein GldH [Bacteroidetes bacterium]|jgi:gliding motility-associated lipoprotein GldH|nr:gliding motility lipoprotein GldH [Bacteroidota bacterium]